MDDVDKNGVELDAVVCEAETEFDHDDIQLLCLVVVCSGAGYSDTFEISPLH